MLALILAAGCATSAPSGDVDASAVDAGGAVIDAAAGDAFVPVDARSDAAPGTTSICQPCAANADCLPDHRCVLTGMGHLCLPQCSQAAPDCPVGFTCGGVESTFCAPIDGVCCVDGDDDAYGEGAGCLGPDCDDMNAAINPGQAELCNGVDDDCDPDTVDGSDDPLVGIACDGPDTDLCTEGTTSCETGGVIACSDATGDDVELCNGVDDDCNPSTADGSGDPLVGVPCDGDDGDLCAEGLTSCVMGGIVCSDTTGTSVEVCNGADDDCDGLLDEDFDFQNDPATCGDCTTTCSNLCCAGGCRVASATDCGACGRTCAEVVLVINEIMIDPQAVGDSVGEWFEIRNLSGFDVDVRGFVLSDLNTTPDTHTITSANPVIVPTGGYLVLGNNATTATNGGVAVDYQYSGFDLGNSGDEIIITAFGTELDRVAWTSSFDQAGKSRELSINHQNSTSNDTLANWCNATALLSGGDTGSPGVANDCSL
ncbi:MAG TPA: lamin tail domain-containing protein [Kofleriaceae bacterium]|nr:lamin tail domain-containing protein [Kofleriaceae bacterium]